MKKQFLAVALSSIMFLIYGCSSTQPIQSVTAETTLITFFDHLNENQFEKAVTLFSADESDWETLNTYSADEEKKDKAKVLETFCNATQTCLKLEVLSTTKNSEDDYTFTVQFKEKDGSIMKYGPFNGVENDPTPPQTKFEYNVKKVGDLYKVITSPLYRP